MRPMGRCQRAQLRSSTLPRAVQRSLHEFVIGEMIKAAEGVSVARTPRPTAQRKKPALAHNLYQSPSCAA